MSEVGGSTQREWHKTTVSPLKLVSHTSSEYRSDFQSRTVPNSHSATKLRQKKSRPILSMNKEMLSEKCESRDGHEFLRAFHSAWRQYAQQGGQNLFYPQPLRIVSAITPSLACLETPLQSKTGKPNRTKITSHGERFRPLRYYKDTLGHRFRKHSKHRVEGHI